MDYSGRMRDQLDIVRSVVQTVAPSAEPMHIDAAKLHISETGTDRDTLLAAYIGTARGNVEHMTTRQLLHARYQMNLDRFPWEFFGRTGQLYSSGIVLAHAPVVGVVSFQYTDTANVTQTLVEGTDFTVSITDRLTTIWPAYNTVWPCALPVADSVRITYNAGYVSPFVADATADTLTVTGPVTWAVDDAVRVSNSGGALPGGLVAGTTYYVKTAASGVYTLAATVGGSAINLTTAGTGLQFIGAAAKGGAVPAGLLGWMMLRIGTLWANREDEVAEVRLAGSVTLGFADRLLDPFTVTPR